MEASIYDSLISRQISRARNLKILPERAARICKAPDISDFRRNKSAS